MAINTARLSNFVGMICQVTQLLVSYNPRTMNTVEELQQVDRQTTRSRQKTARRPVAKKRDRPIDSAVCSLIK
ncbi:MULTISPECIES: hypothetical protein [unclassified Microcoleus]|uniref:hypothetical protein n=1 Tax=unclassified Microcoleus TaxID=2642155 RepID=UPI002FD281F3